MKKGFFYHFHIGLLVLIAFWTVYYYVVPTTAQGMVYFAMWLVSTATLGLLQLPLPQGNVLFALLFGVIFGLASAYGALFIFGFILGFGRPMKSRRGMTTINGWLYGWLISTLGIIVFVYAVAPFFGWSVVGPMLIIFSSFNSFLSFIGANWLTFNTSPPPPFLVTYLPQFILYWATFTGFVIGIIELFQLIVLGFTAKKTKGNRG